MKGRNRRREKLRDLKSSTIERRKKLSSKHLVAS
jgi:hypothetical protein